MASPAVRPAWVRKRMLGIAGVLVVSAVAAAVAVQRGAFRDSGNESKQPLFEVAEGPLTISVTESGTVQPREQVVIKSEVEGTTAILYLIPEGTRVKQGDLLVELDASNLEDSKVDQEISVQNAEAAFISARESLEVVRNQAQSDTDEAELALRFAQEDLKNYKEGEYPNQEKELEARITLAKEELTRAQEEFKWSEILYTEKYLSESELKADKLAVSKAELDLELAQSNLALLKDYTYTRTLDQLESDVRRAQMALERARLRASADVVQAEAKLKAGEAEFTREQTKLKKIEEQIQKARIVAPTDGLVVYATSAEVSHPRHSVEPLDEGQQVRERQELIHLPTGSTFKATVQVHESSLEKIRPGLTVRITVDALPGKAFTGKVASIAPLPDAQSMFMNPDLKVYDTEIDIDGGAGVLRSGMTCKAEIIVEQYHSATYVPVQSVVRVGGKPTAFVKTDDGIEQRPIRIGLDNNRMVHVISGLAAGEMVLLNPPLAAAAAVQEPQEVMGSGPAEADRPTDGPPAEALEEAGETQVSPVTDRQPSERRGGGAGDRPSGSWGDLTPEERQRRRERFESMSPEEREAMRKRREQMRQQGDEERSGQDR